MPLIVLPAPCWTFVCDYEDIRSTRWREHVPDPAQLLFMHGTDCCRPYQLDVSCIEAVCDHCRIPYLGRHFATTGDAIQRLLRLGWTVDRQRGWCCQLCPIPHRLTTKAATHRLDEKGAITNARTR